MTRLGYTHASVATVSERVIQKATRACLLACARMHSARPKAVCHCDIRFANVLWDPQPFLADLEFADFSPWKVTPWISDTLPQTYTNLQSLVNCLDHRGIASATRDEAEDDWLIVNGDEEIEESESGNVIAIWLSSQVENCDVHV